MSLPRLSSRRRLTVRLALGLLVLTVVGGIVVVTQVRANFADQIDDDLRDSSASIAQVLEIIDPTILDRLDDDFRYSTRDDVVVVVNARGVVASLPAGDAESPDPLPDISGYSLEVLRGRAGEPFTVDDVAGGDDAYRIVTAPLADGSLAIAGRTLAPLHEAVRVVARLIFFSFIVLLCGLVLLVWLISRQALRPLEDVISSAEEISGAETIGAGSLSSRIEIESTAPDVARLTDSLNTMLGRIQDAFADRERSDARLRQFVADASHELRTPLAAILGYAELYHEGIATEPDQVEKSMGRIVTEGTRMSALIEDLLLLARLDQGRELTSEPVDLREAVDESVSSIRAIDQVHTFVTSPGDALVVIGDRHGIRQICDNLLTNVVAHTPPGTRATVTVTHEGPDAVLTVSDDGPGMTADETGHALDRFWRAEHARSRPGGSGLGLSIVDELVRAQDGRVTVRSAPGTGTTIEISLPLASS